MTVVWCRNMDCINMHKVFRSEDSRGKFGICNEEAIEEVEITSTGCADYDKEKTNER